MVSKGSRDGRGVPARDLYTIVMKVFAHCVQLLLHYYVQPDDGHEDGRNM